MTRRSRARGAGFLQRGPSLVAFRAARALPGVALWLGAACLMAGAAPERLHAQSQYPQAASTPPKGALARGQALLAKGNWTGALLVLRPALGHGAEQPALHSALARVYSEIGEDAPEGSAAQEANFRRALTHAQREVQLAPESPQAHLDVSIAQGKIARVSGAKAKLKLAPVVAAEARRAIELDADNWQAYHVLGIWNREIATIGGFKKIGASLMGGLPKASLADAIANLETARRLAPGSIRNHLELGRTYLKADREADARAEFQEAIDMPPTEPRDAALQREARAELAELR